MSAINSLLVSLIQLVSFLLGIACAALCGATLSNAPSAVQEIGGVLLFLGSILCLGAFAMITLLKRIGAQLKTSHEAAVLNANRTNALLLELRENRPGPATVMNHDTLAGKPPPLPKQ